MLVSFKNIRVYIIFVIVGIIEKYNYSLIQYESAKYLYYLYI